MMSDFGSAESIALFAVIVSIFGLYRSHIAVKNTSRLTRQALNIDLIFKVSELWNEAQSIRNEEKKINVIEAIETRKLLLITAITWEGGSQKERSLLQSLVGSEYTELYKDMNTYHVNSSDGVVNASEWLVEPLMKRVYTKINNSDPSKE